MKIIKLNRIQYRFWINTIIKQSNQDNLSYAFRIEGELNKNTLTKSLHILFSENDILHSTIETDEYNIPYWRVHEQYTLPFQEGKIPLDADDQSIEGLIYNFSTTIYHLENEFPCKFLLLEKKDHDHFLVLHFHHICLDGISYKDFIQELSDTYTRISQTSQQSITPKDYTIESFNEFYEAAQNTAKADITIESFVCRLKKKQLYTDISLLKNNKSTNSSTYRFLLGPELIKKCQQFCTTNGTTLFRLFCASWGIVVSIFTNSQEIVIDHAINMRPSLFPHLIGSFVNNLPLAITIEPTSTAYTILEQIQRDRKLISEYPYIDYLDLIPALRKGQGKSINPPNIAINYPISYESTILEFNGCNCSLFYIPTMEQTTDLNLSINNDENGTCEIIYRASISASTIKEFSLAFEQIIMQIISNPEQTIASYRLISQERQQEIISKNKININNKYELIQTLDNKLKYSSKDKAIIYQEQSLSYQELDYLSNTIAYHIRQRVNKNNPIGLQIERSLYIVPAILGILKAGCIYVPLDPHNPIERSKHMIEDANIQLIITNELSTSYSPVPFITLHELVQNVIPETKQKINWNIETPENIAYIIYTSGTTGKPKGVPITFAALEQMIKSIIRKETFDIQERNIVLQMASINFDSSIIEIFTTLYAGATLVIASEEERINPDLLIRCLKEKRITTATIPPALLAILPTADLPALETLIFAGEATSQKTFERWRDSNRRLINAYGPTENTVCSTVCIKEPKESPIDIGTPLPNISCYIMNDNHQILPPGIAGELYIGGNQLTHGYINQADLNSVKFIDNPFVSDKEKSYGINTKLYKTGDKVRLLPNGHIEFLGRIDNQIKINGYRVEPQEIELLLNTYKGIKQAIVSIRENNETKSLIAYIQLENKNCQITKDQLRSFLQTKIPKYMIPSVWLFLDKLPLTINGKIDYGQLSKYTIPQRERLQNRSQKSNIEESILSHIISTILESSNIEPETDLFDLGLTSIQAIQAIANANSLGIDISVSNLYKARTIRAVLENKKSKLCFWANNYDENKPLLLLICGFSFFSPAYQVFVDTFKSDYSILVLESYMELFWNKRDCNIDTLTSSLFKLVTPILQDKTLYAIAGYCIGGDIALHLANKLYNAKVAQPHVFMLDSFAKKNKEYVYIEEPGLDSQISDERNRISNALNSSIYFQPYEGNVSLFLASEFTPQLATAPTQEKIDQAYSIFLQNGDEWKRLLPHCQIFHIPDTDHWRFLIDAKALAIVKNIIAQIH